MLGAVTSSPGHPSPVATPPHTGSQEIILESQPSSPELTGIFVAQSHEVLNLEDNFKPPSPVLLAGLTD